MWHLKCFAFWCCNKIFSSSKSRLQYQHLQRWKPIMLKVSKYLKEKVTCDNSHGHYIYIYQGLDGFFFFLPIFVTCDVWRPSLRERSIYTHDKSLRCKTCSRRFLLIELTQRMESKLKTRSANEISWIHQSEIESTTKGNGRQPAIWLLVLCFDYSRWGMSISTLTPPSRRQDIHIKELETN